MPERDKLSTKKRAAIAALMTSGSVRAAAKQVNLSERTLWRWLAEDTNFQSALAQAETAAIEAAARQISTGANEAIAALRQILRNEKVGAAERTSAARAILANLPPLRLLGSVEKRLNELKGGDGK